MAEMGKLRIPVYLRIGDGSEHHVGNVVCEPGEDVSTRVPGLLRGVAAEMEQQEAGARNPSGVTWACPRCSGRSPNVCVCLYRCEHEDCAGSAPRDAAEAIQ